MQQVSRHAPPVPRPSKQPATRLIKAREWTARLVEEQRCVDSEGASGNELWCTRWQRSLVLGEHDCSMMSDAIVVGVWLLSARYDDEGSR